MAGDQFGDQRARPTAGVDPDFRFAQFGSFFGRAFGFFLEGFFFFTFFSFFFFQPLLFVFQFLLFAFFAPQFALFGAFLAAGFPFAFGAVAVWGAAALTCVRLAGGQTREQDRREYG